MKALTVFVMTGLVLCLVPAALVHAQARAPGLVRSAAHALTRDQAVALAERQFHARVIRADTRSEGGRTVYVLRLLNESGRVWTVHVDAESGAVH